MPGARFPSAPTTPAARWTRSPTSARPSTGTSATVRHCNQTRPSPNKKPSGQRPWPPPRHWADPAAVSLPGSRPIWSSAAETLSTRAPTSPRPGSQASRPGPNRQENRNHDDRHPRDLHVAHDGRNADRLRRQRHRPATAPPEATPLIRIHGYGRRSTAVRSRLVCGIVAPSHLPGHLRPLSKALLAAGTSSALRRIVAAVAVPSSLFLPLAWSLRVRSPTLPCSPHGATALR